MKVPIPKNVSLAVLDTELCWTQRNNAFNGCSSMKVAIPKDVVELPNCVDTEVKCLNKAWMFRYESTHSETCSKIGSVRNKPSCVGHKGSIEMRYQCQPCHGLFGFESPTPNDDTVPRSKDRGYRDLMVAPVVCLYFVVFNLKVNCESTLFCF